MKPKAQKSQTRRHSDTTAQTGGEGKPPARRLPKLAAVLLVVALAAGGSFAVFEFVLPSRLPPELVGRWRVDGGPMDGTIFEFQRNGTMIGRRTLGDKEG